VAVDDMLARGRQIGSARDEVDVDPRVDADARGMSRVEDRREWIEGVGLPP
jgi:hypothetical protein